MFYLILSIIGLILTIKMINDAFRLGNRIAVATETTALHAAALYNALTPEAKARAGAEIATIAMPSIESIEKQKRKNRDRQAIFGAIVVAAILGLFLMFALTAHAANVNKWTDEESAAGIKKREFIRFALSGSQLKLRFLYALDMDCSRFDGWQYAVIKKPEHGTAEIVPHNGFPSYLKDSPRAKCNEKQIEGQMLTYKPEDGYKGQDSFTFLELSPSGFADENTYIFNVRALEPKPPAKKK